jgi:L-alanine-DL-glutamate epimerase-like enolase superfamily enzyme
MPHLLPELSGQLALTMAEPTLVEDVEDASFEQLGVLGGPSPIRVTNSLLTVTDQPGLGLSFIERTTNRRTGSNSDNSNS